MAPGLVPGLSAWEYSGNLKLHSEQVSAHDARAPADRKFRYFFPYAGWAGFYGSTAEDMLFSYHKEVACAFQAELPGVNVWVTVDARQDNREFNDWTPEEYDLAAGRIADAVLADPCAHGVHVDIEPFHPSHQPFYASLRDRLTKGGKLTSLFAHGEWATPEMLASVDLFVVSGYDALGSPSDPTQFGPYLDRQLGNLAANAKKVEGHYMLGIPASASWGEWERTQGPDCPDGEISGHTMGEYLAGVMEAYCAHRADPRFLGMSLWAMGREPDAECTRGCCRYPTEVTAEAWTTLATACPTP